jgi:hypothetical protein
MSDEKHIDTGGGAYTGGDVNTGGGKFVGRDDYATTGASAAEMAQAFETIYAAIQARPNTSPTDKADLKAEVKEVQAQVAQGEAADQNHLARRLRNIRRMAPDILDVMVDTLASPAQGIATAIRKVMLKAKEEAEA